MRIMTKKQESKMRRNRVYRMIVHAPKPDSVALKKESGEFECWISREHQKERAKLKSKMRCAR